MKKIIIPILALSASLFAGISQKTADEMFDKCMNLDPSKPSKIKFITIEFCDGLWIPIFNGNKPKQYLLNKYNDQEIETSNSNRTSSLNNSSYSNLFGKTTRVETVDEFGNPTSKIEKSAFMALSKKVNSLKTKKEKQEEFMKYNIDVLKYYGVMQPMNFSSIKGVQTSSMYQVVVESFVNKGYIPSTINLSLADRKTKNGTISASLNSYGFFIRLLKYIAETNNSKTSLNRQILLCSFFASKEKALFVSKNGNSNDFIYNSGLGLYQGAKRGDRESVILMSKFANGSNKEISHYLLSIPDVKRNFNYAKKHFNF